MAGGWTDGCLLLVMPGGADLPYCRQLNGPGTASIQGKRHHSCALQNCMLTSANALAKSSKALRPGDLHAGYVEGGGAYLGLCAGAYFACESVEFALGTK